ncbi:MAG TPA: glycosyl hydrolase family 18 protein [Myxococcota bacterium]|nr:glycosyl hydrolase family 18 protein [Myxococcota bacterium]
MLKRCRVLLLASPLLVSACGAVPVDPDHDDSAELALPLAGGAVAVYSDGLQPGFADGSWCTRNLAQTAVVHGGALAASMTPAGWRGLQMSHQPFKAGAFSAVRFWIHGGAAGGQRLVFGVTDPTGRVYAQPLSRYLEAVPANAWAEVLIPLADLGAATISLRSIYWQDAAGGQQAPLYIDDVSLVASGSPTGTTTGGSTTGTTTGGATNGTTGGSTTGTAPGGGAPAGESWVWVYADYSASLTQILTHLQSFTHISPTFYTVNYNYTSGVPYYSNCPFVSGSYNCSRQGANDFGGMTTAQFTAKVKAAGLLTVPAIYGGGANGGTDIGVQNILNNTNGAGTNFINAMVAEAIANGYDGYNIDWEVSSATGAAYADKLVAFINAFKAALPRGASLSIDLIVSNINGTWCSSNNGFADFAKLAKSSLDRVVIEDYTASLGTPTNSCQPVLLSSSKPVACPLNSAGSDVTAMGLMNFMCANLPPSMVVIGVMSHSSGTNRIAGQLFDAIRSYGIRNVAVWPEVEGAYPFLSGNAFIAPQSDWYSLLTAYLRP